MKKKIMFLLMPLLLLGVTGCVRYNGQGKPSKSSASSNEESSVVSSKEGSSDTSSSVISSEQSSESEGSGSSSSEENSPSSSEQAQNPDELPKGTEVTLYLVFGSNGLYKNEAVDSVVESLYLEHALEYTAKVGDLLPTDKDVTTSVQGSRFMVWTAYNNDGKLTEYFRVPGYDKKVLYASYSGGEGGSHSETTPQEPEQPGEVTYLPSSTGTLPTSGYGFKFGDGTFMEAVRAEDNDGFEQFVINNRSFAKDQTFQLCDFSQENAVWTVNIDGWSFGGDSASSENWKEYIENDTFNHCYKVLKDFNASSVYIKLKYGQDQVYIGLGE